MEVPGVLLALVLLCCGAACSSGRITGDGRGDPNAAGDTGGTGADAAGDVHVGDTAMDDGAGGGAVPDHVPGGDASVGDADGGDDLIGDPGSVWTDWTSGTRLRARVMATAAGAEEHVGWHDTALDVDCDFRWADGQIRCLPSDTPIASNVLFADAACSQALVYVSGHSATVCAAPRHVLLEDDSVCPPTARVFATGPELDVADPVYRMPSAADPCTQIPQLTNSRYYRVGVEIPVTNFVSATVNTTGSGLGITVETLTAADGTVAPWQWLDTTTGAPCSLAVASDGQWRCLPGEGVSAGGYYSDAGCRTPLASVQQPASCPDPQYARFSDSSTCGSSTPVYTVGAPVPVASGIYKEYGTSCNALSSSRSRFYFYELGSEVPGSSFVAATMVAGVTRGRLTEELLQMGGALRWRRLWYDSQLGVACRMTRVAEDGTYRCIPDVVGVSVSQVYHSDSSCIEPLIQSLAPCAPSHAWKIDLTTCPARYGVYETAELHTGAVYTSAGVCSLNTVALPFPVYQVGAHIAPAALVPATEVLR